MILGVDILKQLVEDINLVEGLCERERTNPEGAGFDLCLASAGTITNNNTENNGHMGVTKRKTSEYTELDPVIDEFGTAYYTVPAKGSLIITTIESVNLPTWLAAEMSLRSTLYRSGILYTGGTIHPGYCGKLSFCFYNTTDVPFIIEVGARIVHIRFREVKGESAEYRGQWQGGRIHQNELETQV